MAMQTSKAGTRIVVQYRYHEVGKREAAQRMAVPGH